MKNTIMKSLKIYSIYYSIINTFSLENSTNINEINTNTNTNNIINDTNSTITNTNSTTTNTIVENEDEIFDKKKYKLLIEKRFNVNDIISKNPIFKKYEDNLLMSNELYRKNKNNKEVLSKFKYYIKKDCGYLGGCCYAYYIVLDENQKYYFCKITTDNQYEENIINEILYMKELNDKNKDNIVKLHEVYYKKDDNMFTANKNIYYIFTDYCSFGDLIDNLNESIVTNEDILYKYCYHVINSVYNCHSEGIAHRDLKLDNYFVDSDNKLFLGDFGFATKEEYSNLPCGTPFYKPNNIASNKKYNCKKMDIYGLGTILLYIFDIDTFIKCSIAEKNGLMIKFKEENFTKEKFDQNNAIPDSLKPLLSNILANKIEDMPTIEEIVNSNFYKEIKNKFFNKTE